jgi:hypothetical protein
VLNLLRGLNPRFANTADIIANTSPLPDFKSATNMLRVKELRLGAAGKEASASALAASTAPSVCPSSSCPPTSNNRGGSGKGKGGKGKGERSGGGGGGRNQQHGGHQQHDGGFGGRQTPQPAGPWVCYNPWVGLWASSGNQWSPQQWTPPAPPPQQAHTAFAPSQLSAASPAPGSWDAAGLIAALNQLAVQGSSPWVMDSGATSHMSSNDGILLSRLPSPVTSIFHHHW